MMDKNLTKEESDYGDGVIVGLITCVPIFFTWAFLVEQGFGITWHELHFNQMVLSSFALIGVAFIYGFIVIKIAEFFYQKENKNDAD